MLAILMYSSNYVNYSLAVFYFIVDTYSSVADFSNLFGEQYLVNAVCLVGCASFEVYSHQRIARIHTSEG